MGLDPTALFIQDHFSKLKVYDPQGWLLRETVNPSFPVSSQDLAPRLQEFPMDGRPHCNRFEAGQRTIVQWLLPLRKTGPQRIGFLEGVMLLDQEAMHIVKTSIRVGTIAVLLSIAATTLLLYPLMLSLNLRIYRFADEVLKGNIEIASVLGATVAQRDSDTGHHKLPDHPLRHPAGRGPGAGTGGHARP